MKEFKHPKESVHIIVNTKTAVGICEYFAVFYSNVTGIPCPQLFQ